jgi:glyoxylase-like metal-dependent hydrolase (beta-lactamase superfamily II)/8-oxo-dGTP pyrophosphatase MutT (NUDIX family)
MDLTAPLARASATLVLARDGAAGLEVLLVRRADRGDQNSHAWVFPGGLIDETDRLAHAHVADADDAAASARLGLPHGGLDYWICALRETLEEAGLLLGATDAAGRPLDAAAHRALLDDWRARSHTLARGQGGAAFAELCASQGWRLNVRELHPIAHWITPLGMPKRFDTRFLLAAAPTGQPVRIDGVEVVEHRWVDPRALQGDDSLGKLAGPARAVLQTLAAHDGVAPLLAWAAGLGVAAPIQPRLARDAQGRLGPTHPTHPAYAEIGRVDPRGEGLAWHVVRPGSVVAIDGEADGGRLLRLTAGNAGMMTGPGTNSYLLRGAADDWVLIDPGPLDEAHQAATLDAIRQRGGRLRAILATHTHVDHSPGARALRSATGAALYGRVADHPAGQDASFVPDVALRGGEQLDFGEGLLLDVIHTPGHASNHLCYLHAGAKLLFTGDHVMQGSTVVINPPDGDMGAYLASLESLADDPRFDTLAPGHGFLVADPPRLLRALVAHRRQREAKVLRVLAQTDGGTLDELVVRVYDDVPAERHGVARRSLLAHLLHLQAQGRARADAARWHAYNT